MRLYTLRLPKRRGLKCVCQFLFDYSRNGSEYIIF